MNHQTHLDDNLGEDDNSQALKYSIYVIREENDLDQYINKEVIEPEGDAAKSRANRIITYSIKDHLIPHVSSLKTPKEVFDYVTKQSKKNKRLL